MRPFTQAIAVHKLMIVHRDQHLQCLHMIPLPTLLYTIQLPQVQLVLITNYCKIEHTITISTVFNNHRACMKKSHSVRSQ